MVAKRTQRQRAACPFEMAMDILAGKWKGMILRKLMDKPYRYSELQNSIADISHRMLTLALRELEQDGVIEHIVDEDMVCETHYALTAIGQELIPAFMNIIQWGKNYQQQKGMK